MVRIWIAFCSLDPYSGVAPSSSSYFSWLIIVVKSKLFFPKIILLRGSLSSSALNKLYKSYRSPRQPSTLFYYLSVICILYCYVIVAWPKIIIISDLCNVIISDLCNVVNIQCDFNVKSCCILLSFIFGLLCVVFVSKLRIISCFMFIKVFFT